MRKALTLAVAAATGLLLVSTTTFAAEYGGVGSQPAYPRADNSRTQSIFIHQLAPGQQASDGLKVYNSTKEKHSITIQAVDAALTDTGAFTCALPTNPKVDAGSWVRLQTTTLTLAGGASQTIPFTIAAPINASVGEHDACLTLQDAAITTSTSSHATAAVRSAVRLVVTISGKLVKSLTLTGIALKQQKNDHYTLAITAQNEGNVSLDAQVRAELTNALGLPVSQLQKIYPMLPESAATWSLDMPQPFWGGWYRARATVVYSSDPAVELGKSDSHQKTEQLTSSLFFVQPQPLAEIIEALILAVVLGVLMWLAGRFWRNRRKHSRK